MIDRQVQLAYLGVAMYSETEKMTLPEFRLVEDSLAELMKAYKSTALPPGVLGTARMLSHV